MFQRSDLDELLAIDARPAVSLYLPTHVVGREIREDPIRLKNLLAAAAKRLGGELRTPEIAALLEPAHALIGDATFWRQPERGLAVFLAPSFRRIHKLPIAVAEEVVVGRIFHITPLLPLVDPGRSFWVVALSAGRARLYQGSRWSFREITGLPLPHGIAELRRETEYEEARKASPTGRTLHAGGGIARPQAFGEAPAELRKSELIELLQRTAAALEPVVQRQPAPVVVAAPPEIYGNFREIAGWKALLPDGITENPEALAPAELHARAWRLVEPVEQAARALWLERLKSLIATASGKATTRPAEIVEAARHGRVDTLFLADRSHVWGRFDEKDDRVVVHADAEKGDDDLLDDAARMTLRRGGSITLADPAELPQGSPAAAILRY